MSLIEAQAAGLPVVSTEVGGSASVVRDGESGFLAGTEDEARLVRGIRTLLGDAELRTRMGAAGRRRATTQFAIERLVEDLAGLYAAELAQSREAT